jgi:hypothetical protein
LHELLTDCFLICFKTSKKSDFSKNRIYGGFIYAKNVASPKIKIFEPILGGNGIMENGEWGMNA